MGKYSNYLIAGGIGAVAIGAYFLYQYFSGTAAGSTASSGSGGSGGSGSGGSGGSGSGGEPFGPKYFFNFRRPANGNSQFHVFKHDPNAPGMVPVSADDDYQWVRSVVEGQLREGYRVGIFTPNGNKAMEAKVVRTVTEGTNKGKMVELNVSPAATKDVASQASKQNPGYLQKLN